LENEAHNVEEDDHEILPLENLPLAI